MYLNHSPYKVVNYDIGLIGKDDLFNSNRCVNCHFFVTAEPTGQERVSQMFISWNMIIENAPAMLWA